MLSEKARTSFAIAAAGGSIIAAALVVQRTPIRPDVGTEAVSPPADSRAYNEADDGMILTAKLASSQILSGSHEENLAITITAPNTRAQARPPVSLAIVIDRSGSMTGKPIADAKAAAKKLVDRLDDGDAFTVITYSNGDETVLPMQRATASNKAGAAAAIDTIYDDGGTCISCGIERATRELAKTPIVGGVARMVLISDGQPNIGLGMVDRGELAQLAIETASHGTSISTIGVGLDFDEVTMANLAQVGHGNYYFAATTDALGGMFDKELGGLAETFAADVRLTVGEGTGVAIAEAYGYPMTRDGQGVIVPVADLRAGETRKVVLRISVDAPRAGQPLAVSQVRLDWRRVSDQQRRKALTTALVDIVSDPAAVERSIDRASTTAIEQAITAKTLEQATVIYEKQGAAAAQRVIDQRMTSARANKSLDEAEYKKLETISGATSQGFAAAPAPNDTKAKKAARQSAYELAK